jgi:hypothetical protein
MYLLQNDFYLQQFNNEGVQKYLFLRAKALGP